MLRDSNWKINLRQNNEGQPFDAKFIIRTSNQTASHSQRISAQGAAFLPPDGWLIL